MKDKLVCILGTIIGACVVAVIILPIWIYECVDDLRRKFAH